MRLETLSQSEVVRLYLDCIEKAKTLDIQIDLVPSGFKLTGTGNKVLYGQMESITEAMTFLCGMDWGNSLAIATAEKILEDKYKSIEVAQTCERNKEHIFKTSKDCNCNKNNCSVCVGGLSVCKDCGGIGGALTTHCCEYQLTPEQVDRIYHDGDLDFRNGEWVNLPNPTNQKIAASFSVS